jgi:hypothetical protein
MCSVPLIELLPFELFLLGLFLFEQDMLSVPEIDLLCF